MKNLKKYALLSVSTLLTVSMLTGCGKNSQTAQATSTQAFASSYMYDDLPAVAADYSGEYYEENSYYEPAVAMDYEGDYGYENSGSDSTKEVTDYTSNSSVKDSRKIIRTVSVNVETTDYDKFIKGLNTTVESLGGYIENEYSYNGSIYNSRNESKHASITIRVPDDKLDQVISSFAGSANITQKSTSTQDVTLSYVDTESKKEMYLAEQESLLALLEKADSVEDIAYLTERITQVRYNIESMESTLRTLDDLVTYATLNVSVEEVEIYTPSEVVEEEEKTVWQKMSEGFKASLFDVLYDIRDFFVGLVIALPYIIRFFVIIGIIAGIIALIVNIIKSTIKRKKRKTEKAAKKLQEIKEKEEKNDSQN